MKTSIIYDTDLAAFEIIKGNVIGLPTETVYGLGADAENPIAVLKIYKTKNRPSFNPLIVHVKDIEDIIKYSVEVPSVVYDLVDAFSPGPITYIVPRNNLIPDIVTADMYSVAMRIPSHELFREVLIKSGKPIAAPSANMFGKVSPTTADDVLNDLDGKINYVLEGGKCSIGIESTVLSFKEDEIIILRPGFITKEQIEKVVNKKVAIFDGTNALPESPGMLKNHYAPNTPLYLTSDIDHFKNIPNIGIVDLNLYGYLELSALNLFSELRKADEGNFDYIVAKEVDNAGLGFAINDRLHKASQGYAEFINGKIIFKKK